MINGEVVYWLEHLAFNQEKTDRNRFTLLWTVS